MIEESDTDNRKNNPAKTILLVEDETIIAMDETITMEKYGFKVITVNCGEKAIEKVKQCEPDLILMDIDLGKGKIDGTKAAEIILQEHFLPIVFLTSHSEKEMVNKVKGITRYGYVLKNSGEFVLIESINMAFELFEAHQKTKTSEEQFKTVYEQAAVGLGQVYPSGDFIDANQRFCEIVGYSKDELLKINFRDITYPDDLNIEMESIQKIVEKKTNSYSIEKRFINKNNNIIWVRLFSTVVRDEQGEPKYAIAVVNDITSSKKAKEALKESEEQFRAVFETAKDSIFIKNIEQKYIRVNPAMENLFGKKAQDIINKTDIELFGEEAGKKVIEHDKLILKGEIFEEQPTKPVNGVMRTFHTIKVPLRDNNGDIVGICGIARDITEQKQAEKYLQESEQKFRQIAENIHEVVYVYDPNEDRFLYISPTYEQVWERPVQEVYDNPFAFTYAIHPDDKMAFQEQARKEHEEGIFFNLKYRIITPDGKVKWIWSRNFPVIDEHGNHYRTTGVAQDITEQKELEDKLRQSEEKFRLLAENSTDLITMFKDDKVIYVSPPIEKILGYTQEEFLKLNDLDLIHPDERDEITERIERDLNRKAEDAGGYLYRQKHKDGSYRWLETIGKRKIYEDYIITILNTRDITERKIFEDEFKKNQEQFKLLAENSIDLITMFKDFEIVYVSPSIEKILGYTQEEFLNLNHLDLIHPDERNLIEEKMIYRIKNKITESYKYIYRQKHKNGSYKWLETISTKKIINGEVISILNTRDITDRKELWNKLQENEKRFRYILKHDPNAIAVYDKDLNYIIASDRYLNDYGVKEKDIEGKHHYEVFPEMPDRWKKIHQRVLKGEILRNDDDYFEREDGSITYNRWECRPWYTIDGKIGGMITYTEVTTERKIAELSLKKSEEKYRSVVEDQTEVISRFKPDGTFIFVNDVYCRFFGKSKDQLVGFKWYQVAVPEDLPNIEKELEKMNPDNPIVIIENRVFNDKGEIRWMEFINRGFYDDSGNLLEIQSIGRDITERKELQERLKESEEKYRLLANNSTDIIAHLDKDFKPIYISPSSAYLSGYNMDDFKDGVSIFSVVYKDDVEELKQWIFNNIKNKVEKSIVSFRAVRKDGDVRWWESSAKYLYEENGSFNGFIVNLRDITERIEIHEKIIENELKYRTLFNVATESIYLLSEDGDVIDVNETACRMLNRNYNEMLQLKIGQIDPNHHKEKFIEFWKDIPDNKVMTFESCHIRKDGSRIPVMINSVAFRFNDKRYLYGAAMDITERKQAEEKIQNSEKEKSAILNTVTEIIAFYKGPDLKLEWLNEGAAESVNMNIEQAIGKHCYELWHLRNSPCKNCPVVRAFNTGEKQEEEVVTPDGTIWLIHANPIIEEDGQITGVVESGQNITKYRKSEEALKSTIKEKDFLMREINHRVKNNLMMVNSLINLKCSNLGVDIDISDLKHQIDAIRLVHEKLYQEGIISHISFKGYIQDLLETIFTSFTERNVELENTIGDFLLPTKMTVYLGLIINEIATNAIKYGFNNKEKAKFMIDMKKDKETNLYIITVKNTGNTFPEEINMDHSPTLGLRLISTLVEQIDGTVELHRKPHPVFTIKFNFSDD